MKNLIKGLTTMSFVFILAMMFGVVNVNAAEIVSTDVYVDGMQYTTYYDETAKVTRYNGITRNVEIPSSIISDGVNYSVTEIGIEAFAGLQIKSVIIPDSVTTIGYSAFNSNQLTSVIIPDSVTTIGYSAFRSNQLTSVIISNSVTTIGGGAFADNKLTSITIPSSVTTIENDAFNSNQLTSVTIPSSVTTIGYSAFANNPTLTKAVILNDSADMTIGDRDYDVFSGASSDFKLYGYANSKVSEYAIKATEKENSTEFVELKKITSSMISNVATQYFKGIALTPTVKVNDGTKDLELGTDYEVSYNDNDKLGTATIEITGIGDYEYATASKTFTIAKQQYSVSINPLTGATITPSDTINVDYDGSQKYTIKANDGYKITSILVDGVEMLSSLKDDVLTISNPTKDMSIEVKTEEVKEAVTDTDTPTNTLVVDDVKEENPKTFDGILLYIGLGLLSVIGLSGTLVYKNKKRYN